MLAYAYCRMTCYYITALRENWTSWIGLQVPGTVWNNVTTSPARSCAFCTRFDAPMEGFLPRGGTRAFARAAIQSRQWKGSHRVAYRPSCCKRGIFWEGWVDSCRVAHIGPTFVGKEGYILRGGVDSGIRIHLTKSRIGREG